MQSDQLPDLPATHRVVMSQGKLLEGTGTFSEVQEYFMRLFAEADKDGGGMLSCTDLAEVTIEGSSQVVQ